MHRGEAGLTNVVISGDLCAGKTSLARGLQSEADYSVLYAREVLRALAHKPLSTRRDLQDFGLATDSATKGRWLGDATAQMRATSSSGLAIDSARTPRQVAAVREALPGERTAHIHLVADDKELARRFLRRTDTEDAGTKSLEEAASHPIEKQDLALGQIADLVIDTTMLEQNEVLQRVLSHLLLGEVAPG